MTSRPFSRSATALLLVFATCLTSPAANAGYTPDPSAPRAEIPAAYRWDPTHIFPNDAAWESEFTAVTADIPTLNDYRNHLADSASTLLAAKVAAQDLNDRFTNLYMYAQLKFDVDQSNSDARTMDGRIASLEPALSEATSWMEPELLTIAPSRIKKYMAAEPGLQIYAYYFSELWRQQSHTLSGPEERIMALTGNMSAAPKSAFDALLGVDLKFPTVTNARGQAVPLTISGWGSLRASPSHDTRVQASHAFFGTLRNYETTFATLLDGVVKTHIMSKDARGYESCLAAALSPDHISTDAYRMLIDTVRDNLPRTLHRYVDLRRKVMGITGPLTFPDLYNAMIEGSEPTYTYADAQKIVAKGLAPLGPEYVQKLQEGMDPANGWIDVYPNANKRSGAYSNGALARDLHPYVLHNFDNSLDAVFTTAHEMGHAMHSVYSNRQQPPIYAGYTTFLAEIASTCNEALLTDYLLSEADDVDMKLLLLNQRLESIRLTIFRQTLFADFELQFHEYAEAGNPLTPDYLNGLYHSLIQTYYGDQFVLGPNDECEWMFIPHFYYDFYVFTYATGLTSGLALADQIRVHGDTAAQRYIDNMLKAGSSAPPLDILRNAGVDLETPAPIVSAMNAFAETIAQFDRLWTSKYGTK